MRTLMAISIVLIVIGHKWFSFRKHQPRPQPLVIHLTDAIVLPALAFGWILLVGLILNSLF